MPMAVVSLTDISCIFLRIGTSSFGGVGFLQFEYDKSAYPADKEPAYKYRNNYFGPTKLGVSIVYIIK